MQVRRLDCILEGSCRVGCLVVAFSISLYFLVILVLIVKSKLCAHYRGTRIHGGVVEQGLL
jgi:hypothetical protein